MESIMKNGRLITLGLALAACTWLANCERRDPAPPPPAMDEPGAMEQGSEEADPADPHAGHEGMRDDHAAQDVTAPAQGITAPTQPEEYEPNFE
jgi:hypothetical protein